jgi:hypothetical protein
MENLPVVPFVPATASAPVARRAGIGLLFRIPYFTRLPTA